MILEILFLKKSDKKKTSPIEHNQITIFCEGGNESQYSHLCLNVLRNGCCRREIRDFSSSLPA